MKNEQLAEHLAEHYERCDLAAHYDECDRPVATCGPCMTHLDMRPITEEGPCPTTPS